MKKWMKKLGILVLMLLLGGMIFLMQKLNRSIETKVVTGNVKSKQEKTVIFLDPGHGSSDSGKVGVNKILEKDINLKIAKKVKDLLEKKNYQVEMTRTSDETEGTSKMEDMRARVAMINQSKAVLAVSIHQNSYTDSSVHGAQVFYHNDSEEGKRVALILQEAMKLADEDNSRAAKADSSYYMLRKTQKPLVIVECGFLSNWEEAQLLNTEAYQDKMAEAICGGIVEYMIVR